MILPWPVFLQYSTPHHLQTLFGFGLGSPLELPLGEGAAPQLCGRAIPVMRNWRNTKTLLHCWKISPTMIRLVLGKRRRRTRWLVVLDFNYWGKLGYHHKFLQLHGPIDVLLSIPENVWCSSFGLYWIVYYKLVGPKARHFRYCGDSCKMRVSMIWWFLGKCKCEAHAVNKVGRWIMNNNQENAHVLCTRLHLSKVWSCNNSF